MKLGPLLVGLGGFLAAVLASVFVGRDDEGGGGGELDPYAPHEPTLAGQCDQIAKHGVKLFRQWVIGRWGERPASPENILRACKLPDGQPNGSPTEHWEGRAWDWMIPSDAAARALLDYLLASCPNGQPNAVARRAGIMYAIYDRRMWRAYPWQGAPSGSWSPYTGPNPHTDHIHFSFSRAGAAGQTSLYRELEQGIA